MDVEWIREEITWRGYFYIVQQIKRERERETEKRKTNEKLCICM